MDQTKGTSLLDDIVTLSLDESSSIAGVLRRCLVLSYQLNNDSLKVWVESELNGYGSEIPLPHYRKVGAPAKGLFLGPLQSSISDQPIPSAILKEEHRHFAESVKLTEPIAAYEELRKKDGAGKAVIEWPANLTTQYQASFFEGRYALNRAWQEIPLGAFTGLIDTVRTRVLTFALELQKEAGKVPGHSISSIPAKTIQTHVVNIILGDNNVVASSAGIIEINSQQVTVGDFDSLQAALSKLGVPKTEIGELKSLLNEVENRFIEDGKPNSKILQWAKKVGNTVAVAGKELGTEVIVGLLVKYFGPG